MVRVTGSLKVTTDSLLAWIRKHNLSSSGAPPESLDRVMPLDQAGPTDVAFCRFEGEDGQRYICSSNAGIIFVPESLAATLSSEQQFYIPCPYPRLTLIHFLQEFWIEPEWDYEANANPCIHPNAQIADNVRIGPFTLIGPDVVIGRGSRIGSNCHIEHTEIGCDVKIANSVTIGGVGYGYEDDPVSGDILQFPHTGGILIGDRVDIGSNTCVDRGSIGDTVIGNDCKIDNLIHIAHNVKMGARCKVIALAIIGGSVTLGDDAWIAPAAAIRDWCKVGKGAVVGLGAIVTKDVPAHETVVGNPARIISKSLHRYK